MSQGSVPINARDSKGRIFRYQRDEPIGSGASGQVYKARRMPDVSSEGADAPAADDVRRVALKMTDVPKWKAHLADEARLLHQIRESSGEGGQRIVQIQSGPQPLEMEGAFDFAIIELEYLDGKTLREWFSEDWRQRDGVTPDEILEQVFSVAKPLTEALIQLASIGDGGLIHRDLKPDNIMRTSRGLRLFDFNVAREDGDFSKTQHVGTTGYIAPEISAGRDYDSSADLFSLGVILWELVHQKRFDFHRDTVRNGDAVSLKWPTPTAVDLPPHVANILERLLSRLVVDRPRRIRTAREFQALLEQIEAEREQTRPSSEPLARLDMIQLLSELRPSGLASVVTDTTGRVPQQEVQDYLRERMHVEDRLEDWLHDQLIEAVDAKRTEPRLFVLAGNAGDGKSHLLHRLIRTRLDKDPERRKQIRHIADATHALSPDARQGDRLADFFAPFADVDSTADSSVHIVAMNTGMVIRFFDEAGDRFKTLYRELRIQLGLQLPNEGDPRAPWPVTVINLDLRNLLARGHGDTPSFVERMLDGLDPESEKGIPGPKWEQCRQCPAFALCPVAFNLRAIRMEQPRRAIIDTLRRIDLDSDIHLSPRNLWGFIYRLFTGGVERYMDGRRADEGPCEFVRRRVEDKSGDWLLAGHFTELMFQNEGAGGPWIALSRHDPAFNSSPAIDRLHTRLSIKSELDNDPELVTGELGGVGQSLAGLPLDTLASFLPTEASFRGRRRDAAVRRHVMFNAVTFGSWASHDGAADFEALLDAYDAYSYAADALATLSQGHREQLTKVRDQIQEVFQHGSGRRVDGTPYLRVSQPNSRARSDLLVRADPTTLKRHFDIRRLLVPDIHIAAHGKRGSLLELLGYRPNHVMVEIEGIRLTVDLALFEFLQRVQGGQKPSIHDLSQFQTLLFISERLGNAVARDDQQGPHELFIWDGDDEKLYRLYEDDFGSPRLELDQKARN